MGDIDISSRARGDAQECADLMATMAIVAESRGAAESFQALTDAARSSRASRLDALGAAALGDLVLDLDTAALSAWSTKLTA